MDEMKSIHQKLMALDINIIRILSELKALKSMIYQKDTEKILDVYDVASRLKVSVRQVRRYVSLRLLIGMKLGSRRLFMESEIDEFIEKHKGEDGKFNLTILEYGDKE